MMINVQISIQIISAKGPPLIIALKDVHNFEMQAEEPSFCTEDVKMPSSPYTHITRHTHTRTLTHPFLHLCTFLQAESTETSVK